ncbi:Cation efflux family protein [Candida parapsilosis]|uniref:Cation efflux protein transmembrane domain-containing protein n=2 Tax=Candida parapsilosis TaxID=5480 RepID=G8BG67_CANPC|nr:uncharacterized protein CPAR2_204940 [Candida parapsilosis]KAF6055001.1 Cation efflux family protein [Candida parapsilosis]KAF6055976.1 Cation efflux family protein [Candida parapsilosis]KAF6058906.1 Cation efflux family protein [Candida parapsilosis]KAF6067663.1 Cation efflux family protein [Candida parapsilosis]KAI5901892.1 Metal tolerance protein 4 [Candida parapsilosis]
MGTKDYSDDEIQPLIVNNRDGISTNKRSPISHNNLPNHLRHAQYSTPALASAASPNRFRERSRSPNFSSRSRSGNALNSLMQSDYTEFEEFGCPRRRSSFSASDYMKMRPDRPLFHRLLSSHHSVTNPNSATDGYNPSNLNNVQASQPLFYQAHDESTTSLHESLFNESRGRNLVELVSSLRPLRLIGNAKPLCNWYAHYRDDVQKIKNKEVRAYYEEQNYLITKFQEIDNFLDAGKIHYNMLSNYGSGESFRGVLLDNIEETEEPASPVSVKNGDKETLVNGKKSYDSLQGPDMERGNDASLSKFSRFYDVPGNVANDGSKFLGYNEEENNTQVLTAILVNFLVNILLLVGKIAVTLLTNSLSVVASLVDSVLDFLSTFIIYVVNRLAAQNNWKVQHSYPVGRSRLEPLGVLIFSIIIIISFFQVGQESFRRLFFSTPEQKVPATIGFDAILIMVITIVAKLGCWIWCSKSQSSSVQALAQDAMTDIVFNTVSLLMPWLGHVFSIWWFDPLGALLLSMYIIFNWGKTAFQHISNLTGAVADPLEYKVVLYLCCRFAEPIKRITALKIYHVGDNLNVEVDLVFANDKFDLSFKDCHDIAEALQYSIESLPMVERAFVHIDYMEGNYKGHLK